ncbi:MAG: glycosyltransferase family 39 protein [Rikenella sp.]|nr:glycosyltransferase family 39 protein [Rikenella sp.]
MRKTIDILGRGGCLWFFAALLPLFLLRDLTPDNELRYLSIADEALRDGHLFAFCNHGAAYADKPPLYLWFVMLGRMIFGNHLAGLMVWMGLFSVVSAWMILRTMDRWVRPLVGNPDARRAAQGMLATSAYFLGAAAVLRMDMLMCLFIVLALRTFWRMYTGEEVRKGDRWLFPLYLFLAVFTKGPVGILVPLVSTVVFLALQRDWRSIGLCWGGRTWGILAGLCLVWFGAVYLEGGTDYLDNLLVKQTAGRAVDAFHHKAPWWYYGVSVWYSLAPWSLLAIGVLVRGLCCKKFRQTAGELERLFLATALSTLAMLSVVSSKIQIYLLPAFPFFIYIAVLWIERAGVRRWMKWMVGIPAGVLMLALPGVFAAARFVPEVPLLGSVFVPAGAAVLSLASAGCIVRLARGRFYPAIGMLAGGLLAAVFTASFALPRFNGYIGLGEVCRAAKTTGEAEGIEAFYTYGIRRVENVDVYLGRPVRVLPSPQALDSVACGVVLTDRRLIGRDSVLTRALDGRPVHRAGGYAFGTIRRNGVSTL